MGEAQAASERQLISTLEMVRKAEKEKAAAVYSAALNKLHGCSGRLNNSFNRDCLRSNGRKPETWCAYCILLASLTKASQ